MLAVLSFVLALASPDATDKSPPSALEQRPCEQQFRVVAKAMGSSQKAPARGCDYTQRHHLRSCERGGDGIPAGRAVAEMNDEEPERPPVPRRLVWAAFVVAGAALFVRVACYRQVVLESCTACLRASPSRCSASTDDPSLARRTGFDAREDAREQFSCALSGTPPARCARWRISSSPARPGRWTCPRTGGHPSSAWVPADMFEVAPGGL